MLSLPFISRVLQPKRSVQVEADLSSVYIGSAPSAELPASQRIVNLVFTPEELMMGKVKVWRPGTSGHEFIGTCHCNREKRQAGAVRRTFPEYDPRTWRLEYHAPEDSGFRDSHIALHLLPHFKQLAEARRMSLSEYARFLETGNNVAADSPWLRYPYDIHYGVGAGNSLAGGFTAAGVLTHEMRQIAVLARELQSLIDAKTERGDRSLEIKCCGCGWGGHESAAYCLLSYHLLREKAKELLLKNDPNKPDEILQKEIEAWCEEWDFNVTGYSICLPHLAKSEEDLELTFDPEKDDSAGAMILRRYASRVGEIPARKGGYISDLYYYRLSPDVRKHLHYEWIDLLDPRQGERLAQSPSDVLSLVRTFYIYSGGKWFKSPVKEALGRMIDTIRPGGYFVTDADVADSRHIDVDYLLRAEAPLPPTLYFSWPGLEEVEDPLRLEGTKYLPTSLDDPCMRDWFFQRNGRLLLDRYGEEIRRHEGRFPSGVYRKA